MQDSPKEQYLYVFVDEFGDFDFSEKGSSHLILTAVSMRRPFVVYDHLNSLQFEMLENRISDKRYELEYYHCSNNPQPVRRRVFSTLANCAAHHRVDALIVEKRKTHPKLRIPEVLYPKMLHWLVRYVVTGEVDKSDKGVIVITDKLPIQGKRSAFRHGIKSALNQMSELDGRLYRVDHMKSSSQLGLQIADYYCWALGRKYDRNDRSQYDIVRQCLSSEFNVFERGTMQYY